MSNDYDLVLKGGTLVTAYETFAADLAVRGEVICAIGRGLGGRRELDVSGKYLLPGVIDPHVHMQLPVAGTVSSDDFYTGTVAAAYGGVTTIIDFTTPPHGQTPLPEAIGARLEEAKASVVDYALHACLYGWRPEKAQEVREALALGVTSFKFFTTYSRSRRRTDDAGLFEAFSVLADEGGLAVVHAEDDEIITFHQERFAAAGRLSPMDHARARPPLCEGAAVRRVAYLGTQARCPVYFVHLTSALGVEALVQAKAQGEVYGETCPQYLTLTEEVFQGPQGHQYVCSPPMKTPADRERLWQALSRGELDAIGTDHCPFTRAQKDPFQSDFLRIPNGLAGVEVSLGLLHHHGVSSGRITWSRLAALMAERPAKIFGLYPRKGVLRVGSDADVVVFDPQKEVTLSAGRLHMRTDFCPYEGQTVRGWPVITLSRGRVLVDEEGFHGERGRGRFLKRKPSLPS